MALLATQPGEFEIGKMAVTPAVQGLGVGRRLMVQVIALARELGATRLFLGTNHMLTSAIFSLRERRLQAAARDLFAVRAGGCEHGNAAVGVEAVSEEHKITTQV